MLVIDVEGFRTPAFQPKEMAITNGEQMAHYLFKSPMDFNQLPTNLQQEAHWVSRNLHGLSWNSGFVGLHEVGRILAAVTQRENIIYVKGAIKAEYLRHFTKTPIIDVDNLQEFSIPPLPIGKPPCFSHNLNYCKCSIQNVNFIYSELLKAL